MLSPYQATEMVWRARERWAWSTQQQSTAGALGSQGLPDGLLLGWLTVDRAGKPGSLSPSALEGPAGNSTRKQQGADKDFPFQ